MHRFKSNFCLQFHMNKAISVIRKMNHNLYLIKKVQEELQVKILVDENINVFCSFCDTKFNNDALENHNQLIFLKCKIITIKFQYLFSYVT